MKHKQPCFLIFLSFFVFIFSDGTFGATISVINECGFTVWPGISGSPDLNITGFELTQGNQYTLQTPEKWQGQIWGRTGCTFSGSNHGKCILGDCGSGEIECNGRSAIPPVTVAQFDISKYDVLYDVSLINGYNLQMTVEASGGSGLNMLNCMTTGCVDDLNQRCPTELQLESGGGCKSPCQVFGTEEYCCNNSITKLISCKPTAYTKLISSACPRANSDGGYETELLDSTFMCEGENYTVRFCPRADTFSTIKVGKQLSYYDQLISIWGNYTLGFFDYDGSYLGIWFTSKQQNVWIANANNPIIYTSARTAALSIDPNTGNLIITIGGTTFMNITDIQAGPYPNVTATLDETGNFQLINEINKRVLWQSFDHPTNVLLPGMKLGFNRTTGQNMTLISWANEASPLPGAFILGVEPNKEGDLELIIRRRGQPYWTGRYQDVFKSNIPGRKPYYNITCIYNTEGWYLTYEGIDLELLISNYLLIGSDTRIIEFFLTMNSRVTDNTTR